MAKRVSAGERGRVAAAPALQDRPIEQLTGVGVSAAALLRSRGIETVGDLLAVVPRRYLDLRNGDDWSLVRSKSVGSPVALAGRVVDARVLGGPVNARRGKAGLAIVLQEPGGTALLRAVFFRALPGTRDRAVVGATVRVVGVLREASGGVELVHPRLLAPDARTAPIEPVYGSIGSAPPGTVAKWLSAAVAHADAWDDPLPPGVARDLGLPTAAQALRAIHAPPPSTTETALAALSQGTSLAHRRLALEELLAIAVLLERARRATGPARAYRADGASVNAPLEAVCARLKLVATKGQLDASRALVEGVGRDRPMRALLVGDVGSGKTAVAAAASLAVLRAGGAVAWLAPTALVAEQHASVLTRSLGGEGGAVALLLGSTTKRAKESAARVIADGSVRAVVGTHALLGEGALPPALGLVVIDEQHRFGVAQRLAMVQGRAPSPHVLVVSATPIPRTLALARYGDLDVVTLAGRPPGRQPVLTRVLEREDRAFIVRQIERALAAPGGRAFVVVPRIEADDGRAVSLAATTAWLAQQLGGARVASLSGRMGADEQREVLGQFRRAIVSVLVATSVVEVGLDVPDANLMVVLGAEGFGVAQLHQLRGRVGRAGQRAACLLVAESASDDALARLHEVAATDDGFSLAGRDLSRRGAGEWFGARQSGDDATMRFADPLRDPALTDVARVLARATLEKDPSLASHGGLARAAARVLLRGSSPLGEDAG